MKKKTGGRQNKKEGDLCGYPRYADGKRCMRPLKRCICGLLDCDDIDHNGHACIGKVI